MVDIGVSGERVALGVIWLQARPAWWTKKRENDGAGTVLTFPLCADDPNHFPPVSLDDLKPPGGGCLFR